MRNFDPTDADDVAEGVKICLEAWMQRAIQMNPDYVHWGPYEDYMGGDKEGWSGRQIVEDWKAFGPWELDDYNECVNFYFYAERDSKPCEACGQSGYNPETRRIADAFYQHSCPADMTPWNDKITQDEVEALVQEGRLWDLVGKWSKEKGWERDESKPMPSADLVNKLSSADPTVRRLVMQRHGITGHWFGHDAINRWILIETRAKRLGVWGRCEECHGAGSIYTAESARLGLVLWMIHPRKGASRGVDVKNIQESEMPAVLAWLREAAHRNAERFGKLSA